MGKFYEQLVVAHRDESDFEDRGDEANIGIYNTQESHIMDKSPVNFKAFTKVSGRNSIEHLPILPKERAFKWPATTGYLEKGSVSITKSSFFKKSQSNFLNKLSQQDDSKFLLQMRTKSYLGQADSVKTDLIEKHTEEHFYEDHADDEVTDLLHIHDDGNHCMADHFEEVGEPDMECHFDEENDIEYIVHELMDWGFSYEEMDNCFDSTEDLRAAIDFIDNEHDWQVDHECDFEEDGQKPEEVVDSFERDELLAFKLQVDEIRPIMIPDGVKTLPMKPQVRQLFDKKNKRYYYVDDITKKTTWVMPKVPTHSEIDKMSKSMLIQELKRYNHIHSGAFNRALAVRSLKTRRDQHVKDTQLQKMEHVRLPPDWKALVEAKTGRIYFLNTKLKTTQWETPTFEPTLPRGWEKVTINGKIKYQNKQRNQTVDTLEGIYAISLHREIRSREQDDRVKRQNYRHAHRASLKKLIEEAKRNRLEKEAKRKKKRKVTRKVRQERSKAIHKILRECCEVEKAERLRKEALRKNQREKNRDARDFKRQSELDDMRYRTDVLKEARLYDEDNRKSTRKEQRSSYASSLRKSTNAQRDDIDEKYQDRLEDARQRKEDEMMKREEDRLRREEAAERAREVRRQQQEEEEERQKKRAAERAAEEEAARMKKEEEDREKKRMEEERQRQQQRREFHNKASRLIKSKQTGVRMSDFNRVYSKTYNEQWDAIIAGQMKILVQTTPPFSTLYTGIGSGNHARIIWKDTWKQFKNYDVSDAVEALENSSTLQEAHNKLRSAAQPGAQNRPSVASNPRGTSLKSAGGPLPAGWSSKIDPRTGRTYYLNNITKKTSWQLPQVAVQAPAVTHQAPLPMGWSSKVDPSTGRTYYLNNITKKTSWQRPQAAQGTYQAPAVVNPNQLPFPWVAKKDPSTGKVYFQNNQTKRTQWTDPRPLPNGWNAKVDPSTQKTYYINHISKQTSWKDPRPPLRILAVN